jgi:hypothetical protein
MYQGVDQRLIRNPLLHRARLDLGEVALWDAQRDFRAWELYRDPAYRATNPNP